MALESYPCGKEKMQIRRLVWNLLFQNLKCSQQFFTTPEVRLPRFYLVSKTRNDLQLNSREQNRLQSMILSTFITKNTGTLHYVKHLMDLGTSLSSIAPTLLHFLCQGQKKVIQQNSLKFHFC